MTGEWYLTAEWLRNIGLAISFGLAPTMWDESCAVDPSHRIFHLLFKGNLRSIMTSQMVNVMTIAVTCILFPHEAYITVLIGIVFSVFITGLMAPLLFLNIKIGPFESAMKDTIRANWIVKKYSWGTLNDRSLSREVRCILGSVVKGNKISQRILGELLCRDELGSRVRQVLIELGADNSLLASLEQMGE